MEIEKKGLNFYQDVNEINSIKGADTEQGVRAAADQFEAMFLQVVLQNMRDSVSAVADTESVLSTTKQDVFQQMHDAQLASDLTAGGSLGLADSMVEQIYGNGLKKAGELTALHNEDGVEVKTEEVKSAAFSQSLLNLSKLN
jgi:peptidoglycan hydrolase FlgJ